MKARMLAALLLAGSTMSAGAASYDDLNAGISYFNQEQYDSAIIWFDKAINAGDLIPDQVRIAYLDRGAAYAAKGDLQKAIADYTAAIAVKPEDINAYQLRVNAYLALNDLEKSLADYITLQKLRPKDFHIENEIGYLNWELGRYEDAGNAFRTFSTVNHNAWLWLQLVNLRLKRPMSASNDIGIAARVWPGPIALFFEGDLSESDVLETVKKFNSRYETCMAYFFTGMRRLVQGDTGGAIPLLTVAAANCGEDPSYGSGFERITRIELAKITPAGKSQ